MTATGIENRGKPQGGVLAIWGVVEYGDDKEYSETFKQWGPKAVRKQYYYAVAKPSEIATYPKKVDGHRFYGIYMSAGKVVVTEQGMRPEYSRAAFQPIVRGEDSPKSVLGRGDTLYYKAISHGDGAVSVEDDPSLWHAVPGVAISEDQYVELRKCGMARGCRWKLSTEDVDLTPEQREYVIRRPIEAADMKRLIKESARSRRQHNRWL